MPNGTRSTYLAALVVSGVLLHALLAGPLSAGQGKSSPNVIQSLAGFWKAPEYRVPISSDLDVQVWGPGASKIRNVELALESGGDAMLRVNQSVVDRRGRTRPYSASVIEAKLKVEPPDPSSTSEAIEPRVTVLQAEERYLDGTDERRAIEGLTVKLHTLSSTGGQLNVRFDTAQGYGSFGETLQRRQKTAAR